MSTRHCGSNDEIVGSPQEMPLEASSSTESICVTRRSVTNPKRLFISIPRNDSLNDVGYANLENDPHRHIALDNPEKVTEGRKKPVPLDCLIRFPMYLLLPCVIL